MKTDDRHQSGQSLAHVAILMVVLLGFAALAIDGGRIYLERRRMQNAADAGALAGAWEICFGDGSRDPLVQAKNYAVEENLADPEPTTASYEGADSSTVRVVAWKQVDMTLARIIGQNIVNVGAAAAAQCSRSISAGGLWPLTVKLPDWLTLVECSPEPEAIFTVYTDQNANEGQTIDCYDSEANPDGECDCENMELSNSPNSRYPEGSGYNAYWATLLGSGAISRLGAGQRGWADMPGVESPLLNPGECDACGGANNLGCWMWWTHPATVAVCDQIGSESGVVWSDGVRDAIEFHTDKKDTLNIPLWDTTCDGPGTNSSCNANYLVAGFGCIRVLGYATVSIPELPEYWARPNKTEYCKSNFKIIFAEKVCDCESTSGSGGGGKCEAPYTCSVSLMD